MFKEHCNNHTCTLNEACQTYCGNTPKENVNYFTPKIFFDEQGKPRTYCNHLVPYNIDYIVRQSKMNYEADSARHTNKITMKMFDIVDEFGAENKVKLMKDLKTLVYDASKCRRKVS